MEELPEGDQNYSEQEQLEQYNAIQQELNAQTPQGIDPIQQQQEILDDASQQDLIRHEDYFAGILQQLDEKGLQFPNYHMKNLLMTAIPQQRSVEELLGLKQEFIKERMLIEMEDQYKLSTDEQLYGGKTANLKRIQIKSDPRTMALQQREKQIDILVDVTKRRPLVEVLKTIVKTVQKDPQAGVRMQLGMEGSNQIPTGVKQSIAQKGSFDDKLALASTIAATNAAEKVFSAPDQTVHDQQIATLANQRALQEAEAKTARAMQPIKKAGGIVGLGKRRGSSSSRAEIGVSKEEQKMPIRQSEEHKKTIAPVPIADVSTLIKRKKRDVTPVRISQEEAAPIVDKKFQPLTAEQQSFRGTLNAIGGGEKSFEDKDLLFYQARNPRAEGLTKQEQWQREYDLMHGEDVTKDYLLVPSLVINDIHNDTYDVLMNNLKPLIDKKINRVLSRIDKKQQHIQASKGALSEKLLDKDEVELKTLQNVLKNIDMDLATNNRTFWANAEALVEGQPSDDNYIQHIKSFEADKYRDSNIKYFLKHGKYAITTVDPKTGQQFGDPKIKNVFHKYTKQQSAVNDIPEVYEDDDFAIDVTALFESNVRPISQYERVQEGKIQLTKQNYKENLAQHFTQKQIAQELNNLKAGGDIGTGLSGEAKENDAVKGLDQQAAFTYQGEHDIIETNEQLAIQEEINDELTAKYNKETIQALRGKVIDYYQLSAKDKPAH